MHERMKHGWMTAASWAASRRAVEGSRGDPGSSVARSATRRIIPSPERPCGHSARLAQLAEQLTLNQRVRGSIPWSRIFTSCRIAPHGVVQSRNSHIRSGVSRFSIVRPPHRLAWSRGLPAAPSAVFWMRSVLVCRGRRSRFGATGQPREPAVRSSADCPGPRSGRALGCANTHRWSRSAVNVRPISGSVTPPRVVGANGRGSDRVCSRGLLYGGSGTLAWTAMAFSR